MNERMRFAPSPTGDLHVGGARAALFNWLYARKVGGKFLLRIEDTDTERSTQESLDSILGSLKWLGLNWDEDLVFQSKRSDIYTSAVNKLIESGSAYRCFCSVEELEAEREHARVEKLPYKYSEKCRHLNEDEINRLVAEKRQYTVRFKVPEGETYWDDLVHDRTAFKNENIGDFIIARTDGSPVYLLGVAVDDSDMGITLVMRGDDHIPNTPKQIMLMNALGSKLPRFAHLPQVLGMDKKKLSKRHGAASVLEYQKMGFLPQAVVNFLALLGWAPGDEREKMELDELIQAFSIENISKKSSVFDLDKLQWLNGQYLNDMPPEQLLKNVSEQFTERGYISSDESLINNDYILSVIKLLKERCRLFPDFADLGGYFFKDPDSYDPDGVKKHFSDKTSAEYLEMLAARFEKLSFFDESTTEETTRLLSEELNIKTAKLIHPTRLAVSGMTFGPGLYELLALLGKDRVIKRMEKAIEFIRNDK